MPIMTDDEFRNYIESREPKRAQPKKKWLNKIFGGGIFPPQNSMYVGHRTYHSRLPLNEGKTYFYYFGPRATTTRAGSVGELRAWIYTKPRGKIAQRDELEKWIAHAKTGNGNFNPEKNIEKVEWNEPCFLIFFVDFDGWEYYENGNVNESLYFLEDSRIKTHGNYTFYNARSDAVTVEGQERKVLVVENHHLKAPEENYPNVRRKDDDPPDNYRFDIYLGVPIEGVPGQKMWFIVDPGGRNVGPP